MPTFFLQAEDGIRDTSVTGVQTCALPICHNHPPTDGCSSLLPGKSETTLWQIDLPPKPALAGRYSSSQPRYIHRGPEYLRSVREGIESLYAAVAVLVRFCNLLNLERETRLELATPTLARPEDTK